MTRSAPTWAGNPKEETIMPNPTSAAAQERGYLDDGTSSPPDGDPERTHQAELAKSTADTHRGIRHQQAKVPEHPTPGEGFVSDPTAGQTSAAAQDPPEAQAAGPDTSIEEATS